MELKSKLLPATTLVDEVFDVKKANAYRLVLCIGVNELKLAVKETLKNRFIAFERYTFENVYGLESAAEALPELNKLSKLIAGQYKKVSCFVVNNLSTIVPVPLYEDSRKIHYLQFNAALSENEIVIADDIKNLDARNVFALPGDLQKQLYRMFPGIQFHHFSSALIAGLLAVNKNQTVKKLYVHVQPNQFEAIVIEGKHLHFYNTFNYQTAEDFIYYLLFVCEQLQLNPETIETVLLGDIEKSSEYYSLAYKYIRNIKIGERNDSSDYGYQLQILPKHSNYALFSDYGA